MAGIEKYSDMDKMRGKFGKIIISKNRYKSFAYEQKEYIDKQSPSQLRTRELHKEVIKLWQTLTPDEIDYIDKIASEDYIRSMCKPAKITDGHSLFYYLKRNLQEIGEKIEKTVNNIVRDVQHINSARVEWKKLRNKTGIRLFIEPNLDENTKLIVYATHSIPGGIGKPKESWYRKIKVIDKSYKSGSFITSDYMKVFKEIDDNAMTIYFRYKTVDRRSGIASNPEIVRIPLYIKEKS